MPDGVFAMIYMIQPNIGRFYVIQIRDVNRRGADMMDFRDYLRKHWKFKKKLWEPISLSSDQIKGDYGI